MHLLAIVLGTYFGVGIGVLATVLAFAQFEDELRPRSVFELLMVAAFCLLCPLIVVWLLVRDPSWYAARAGGAGR